MLGLGLKIFEQINMEGVTITTKIDVVKMFHMIQIPQIKRQKIPQ